MQRKITSVTHVIYNLPPAILPYSEVAILCRYKENANLGTKRNIILSSQRQIDVTYIRVSGRQRPI